MKHRGLFSPYSMYAPDNTTDKETNERKNGRTNEETHLFVRLFRPRLSIL